MNRDIDALFKAGNQAQREKLEKNGHKKGFDDIDIWKAFCRLRGEVEELDAELSANWDCNYIRHEAADIANFAHMIILVCDKELSK